MVTETKTRIEILRERVKERQIDNSETYYNPVFTDGYKMSARGRMDEDQWMLDQIKELTDGIPTT